jgi:glucose-6-phosphate isomerase
MGGPAGARDPRRPPRGMRLQASDARAVTRRLAALSRSRFAARLERAHPALWGRAPGLRRAIARRLGWLRAPGRFLTEAGRLEAFAREARDEGLRHAVLLGMGGASLAPEVLRRVFGPAPGFLDLLVLDTTVPSAVERAARSLPLESTLFLVSSKSGTTIEMQSLFAHFWGRVRRLRGAAAGRHFAAVTDPGTPLADLATTRGFRATFHNPDDIGGRYSALSFFGLVPAALLGIDPRALLGRAVAMGRACGPGPAARDNPGLALGAALGELARHGRDKVVLLIDPPLQPFGLWIEQLLAESTGKRGRGLVPVVEALAESALAEHAGPDRVLVAIALEGGAGGRLMERFLETPAGAPGAPTPYLALGLADRLDLGGSMLQWMVATSVAGAVLGINPFDEPNVKEAKEATESVLEQCVARGRMPEEPAVREDGRARLSLSRAARRPGGAADLGKALGALLSQRRRGDYVALLVYADPEDEAVRRGIERARAALAARTGLAVTSGYGPRYLHSTGQLHKGGANRGLFLVVVPDDAAIIPIPGRPYDLETLKQAQALGDFQTLERRGRRALRVRYAGRAAAALRLVAEALEALPAAASARSRAARLTAPRRPSRGARAAR